MILISCTTVLLVAHLIQQVVDGDTFCGDAYECASDSYLSGRIECYGYNSCRQADTIFGTGEITCAGSYSCYGVNEIIQNKTGYASECSGLSSCANIVDSISLNTINADLICGGESSCYGSTINGIGTNYIDCRGYLSCAETIINNVNYLNGYGYLSLYNSVIDLSDNSFVDLRGIDAGFGATFICGAGYTCDIYCYSHGCNNITTICDNCTQLTIDCDSVNDYESNSCPNALELPSYIDMNVLKPNLLEYNEFMETATTYENSNFDCSESLSNATNCDDYHECSSQRTNGSAITLEDNINNNLCCTALESCYSYVSPVSGETAGTLIRQNSNIRCDGGYGCAASFNISTTMGHLYMTGYNSGGVYASMKGTAGVSDLHCTGGNSCAYNLDFLLNFRNIYCLGYYACYRTASERISNVQNIFIYGYQGVRAMGDISNLLENGTVYCNGYFACYQMGTMGPNIHNVYATGFKALYFLDIIGITNDVIAVGYQILQYSTIYNISNELICVGTYCLRQSTVENVEKVICEGQQACYLTKLNKISQMTCIGTQSCQNARIANVYESVKAYGNDSLIGATIISGISSTNELYITIYDDNTNGDFDIYCNSSMKCYIDCQSSAACMYAKLYCDGKCYVNCDETNDIRCPYFGDFYFWDKSDSDTTNDIITSTQSATTTSVETTTTAIDTTTSVMDTTMAAIATVAATTSDNSMMTTAIATTKATDTTANGENSEQNDDSSDTGSSSNEDGLNMNVVFICICATIVLLIAIGAYIYISKMKMENMVNRSNKQNMSENLENNNDIENENETQHMD